MAMNAEGQSYSDSSWSLPTGDFRSVARQPILDARGEVHGNELLFWNGRDTILHADSDRAFRSLLDNTVLFGLDQMAGGLPAFVNCSPDTLTEEWMQLLPPAMTVIELQADLEYSTDVLENCHKLKSSGFRFALDGFRGRTEPAALLDLADYVKVDVQTCGPEEREEALAKLASFTARPIAYNVQTQEAYREAYGQGFKLFQGFYFCRPEMLKNHRIPANRLVHMEIMELVQKETVDLKRLSQLVSCDASLTYRLLRLVNSPLCAMRQEVTSIQSALMLIGERTFRHLAILAIASDFNGEQPQEILRISFERGRFCELAAGLCGMVPSEQYLIGMISMFPAMLRIPMEDMVRTLPLREKAREALLGRPVLESILLQWLVGQEREDWRACDIILSKHRLPADQMMRYRAEAISWANTALNSAAVAR
jgi:EAL and modified HD-GYP domain-containing signal transduction protein